MKNIEVKLDEKKKVLTLTVDLTKEFGDSVSGKTTIIASSEGNAASGLDGVKFGLNVFRSKEKTKGKDK